jgi:hypothetical protein
MIYGLTQIQCRSSRRNLRRSLRIFLTSHADLRGLLLRRLSLIVLYAFICVLFIRVDPRGLAFAHTEDVKLNQEIQKGKEIVEKFYRGEVKCQNLNDEYFHSVGEYVMEQMVDGSDHLTMNKMIKQMHDKKGEELMHIDMGKRFLGCNGGGSWMMPMMPMMGSGIPMMGYWGYWNWRGWNFLAPVFSIFGSLWLLVVLFFPILFLILLILVIIYLIKKLKSEIRKE